MQTDTTAIEQMIKFGERFLREQNTAYLPKGVSGTLAITLVKLKGIVRDCQERDARVSAMVAKQSGGIDHSLPAGDR